MSRRWPSTAHWKRLESTFRETNGSHWRAAGAALLGCERRNLRALIDRDLHPVEIRKLDAALIDHLHRYASYLQERAEDICNVAREVMRATYEVSTCPDPDTWMRESDTSVSLAGNPEWDAAMAALLEDA